MNSLQGHLAAVLDTCVLFSVLKRNILLSLAGGKLFIPKWSDQIMKELERSLRTKYEGRVNGRKQCKVMNDAFPDARIFGYESKINDLKLPDSNDRHILAAAITGEISIIVTDNICDFPTEELAVHSVSAITTDEFTFDIINRFPSKSIETLKEMRMRISKKVELDASGLIKKIKLEGMSKTSQVLKSHLHEL